MKIKLLHTIPVEEKHGLVVGRIMEVEKYAPHTGYRNSASAWVKSDVGELVKLTRGEFEIIGR